MCRPNVCRPNGLSPKRPHSTRQSSFLNRPLNSVTREIYASKQNVAAATVNNALKTYTYPFLSDEVMTSVTGHHLQCVWSHCACAAKSITHLESDPTIHLLWGYDHFIYDDMMDSPEKCTIVSKPLLLPCYFWRICGIYVEFLPFPAVITAVTAV